MLSSAQVERLSLLAEWLAERAPPLGLSRYRDIPAVLTRALAPALSLSELIDVRGVRRIMDLGAGSGALGFTLALARPHLVVDLVDRRAKAATFLELTAQHVGISNARVIHGDARELRVGYSGRHDLLCFRALAEGGTALGLAYRFAAPKGYIAAWHRTDDASFGCRVREVRRIGSAETLLPGLVVSLYGAEADH